MRQDVEIFWKCIGDFDFTDKPNWYYVWFDDAYFEEIYWDGHWFYRDENNKPFEYVYEIQWIALRPIDDLEKLNFPSNKKFKDYFPNICV